MKKKHSQSNDKVRSLHLKKGHIHITNVSNFFNDHEQKVISCEFCDEVFFNRSSSMIHNASHIIIPLLKQTYVQCNECLHHFTSLEELRNHITKNHPEVVNNTSLHEKTPNLISNTIEYDKENFTNISDVGLECNVKIESDDEYNYYEKPQVENEGKVERFIFKDESGDDFFNDFAADCNINLESFNSSWLHNDLDINIVKSEPLYPEKAEEKKGEEDVYYNSVHYDDLMRPGIYKCRCGKSFPNRFELIVHDKAKVKIRKPKLLLCIKCERYIVGNYHKFNKHVRTAHPEYCSINDSPYKPGQTVRVMIYPLCKLCGFKYSDFDKHCQNYHETHKVLAPKYQKKMKTCVKVCNVCFMFLKNRNNMTYKFIEDYQVQGLRHACERCGQLHFSLKLFEIVRKKNPEGKEKFVNKIRFEEDRLESENQCKKSKTVSNIDRLKNIRNRLKMLNKYSKC